MEASVEGTGRLRALFARSGDPYAGADLVLARRFGVAMWVFASVVVLVLEAFYPPTKAFGNLGWALSALGFAVAATIVRVLADKRRAVGFDFLLGSQYVGLILVAATQHGAGGRVAPYH